MVVLGNNSEGKMDITYLKYFKDAAFYENFSKAAQANFVPQSSISKAVKALEVQYETNLFDRVGKSIFLNDNGRFLYEKVCLILDNLQECEQHFSYASQQNISVYVQDAGFFIALLSADYMRAHPKHHLSHLSYLDVQHSSGHAFDFTFMPKLDDMSGYNYEELLTDEFVLLVSKEHPLADYDEVTVDQLKDEDFICLYSSMWARILTNSLCNDEGSFTPNVIFETNDEDVILYLVAKNEGITLFPRRMYYVHPEENIKVINIKNTITTTSVIAWQKDKKLSKIEQGFLDFSKEWFSKYQ